MNKRKTITLQFNIKKLLNLNINISQKSFNLEFEDINEQLIELKKYPESSKIEKEIKKSMIEKANKIFNQNEKFESEMLFMHYMDNNKIVKIDSLLIINGYLNQIKHNEKNIQIICSLDNKEFEMQVIKMDSDSSNKHEMKEIGLCSEDTCHSNQIIFI